MNRMTGVICSSPIYEYCGWLFEYDPYRGVWPLKKDGEHRKKAGNKFWKVFSEWFDLSEKEQRKTRVGGGCIKF